MTRELRARTETERKFGVDETFDVPDLGDLVEVRSEGADTLLTTYLDTADRRLWRDGIVVRHRVGGPDAGWHLKFPAALTDDARAARRAAEQASRDTVERRVRREIQLPATDDAATPPAALVSLVRVRLDGAALVPQAQLRTHRTRYRVVGVDGTALAELDDDRVTVLHDGVPTTHFRELELEELTDAPVPVLDAVAARLVAAGARPPEAASKAVRALGDPRELPPLHPPVPRLSPATPAATAVQAHLLTHVRALRREDLRVRLDAPDSIHQLRVATRRLRSGLRAFRPLLVPGWDTPLRDALRWLARGLAAARDSEVLLDHLDERARELPDPEAAAMVRAFLRDRLGAELAHARESALAVLDSDRYLAVHADLLAAARRPATTPRARRPCRKALPPLTRRAFRQLEKAVQTLGAEATDETWHQARIVAKRARYTAEATAPALGRPARRLADQLAKVTDVLGEHHDAVVAADTLTRLAMGHDVPARTAYWLGVLHQRERAAARAATASFADTWRRVRWDRLLHQLGEGG